MQRTSRTSGKPDNCGCDRLDASAEKLVLSTLKTTLTVAGASAEGVVSLGSSRNYASHNEKFVFVISYRSEAQEEMLRITDSLRVRFGDRCVVHGMMCKPVNGQQPLSVLMAC